MTAFRNLTLSTETISATRCLGSTQCAIMIPAAWAKAYTVAAFRSMSPRFPDGLVIQQWFKERNPQLMIAMTVMSNGRVAASGGAAPVFKGNQMVGCYGISGATSDQDEVIGQYARGKCGWAHLPADDNTPPDVKKHINELYAKAGIKNREL